MKNKLFLTGPSGSGKTTSLIQVLSSIQGDIGGFMVQRIRSGGQVIGYSMVPAKDMDQVWANQSEPPTNCFLTMGNTGLCFHPDRFAESFQQLTQKGDLIVLDEIGGIELQLPQIRLRILELLKSDTPLLAVWKSRENLLHVIQHGKVSSALLPLHQEVESILLNHPKAAILSVPPSQELLLRFLKANGLHKDLPGRASCLERLHQCSTAIQAHSLNVTKTVAAFSHYFQAKDPEMLIQAALLHDVERHQKNHAQVLAQLLLEQGYDHLASIVGQHMVLSPKFYNTDAALLWLADKCCLEDQLVHPKLRFQASLDRYGPTESIQMNLRALDSFQLEEHWDPKKILDQYGGHHENDFFNIEDLFRN